jgi:hypothetical protein
LWTRFAEGKMVLKRTIHNLIQNGGPGNDGTVGSGGGYGGFYCFALTPWPINLQ